VAASIPDQLEHEVKELLEEFHTKVMPAVAKAAPQGTGMWCFRNIFVDAFSLSWLTLPTAAKEEADKLRCGSDQGTQNQPPTLTKRSVTSSSTHSASQRDQPHDSSATVCAQVTTYFA
jgi:hypothetical protein